MKSPATTLDQLTLDNSATIVEFSSSAIQEKMLEMGCLPGTKVILNRIAPLGDPIIIEFEDTKLALRKDEAKFITISIHS